MAAERAMLHYLARHGESKSELEDPAKPLSDRGREDVLRVARYTASIGLEVAEIRHSNRLRAQQTAEILAEHLTPRLGIRKTEGLAPGDESDRARAELEAAGEPLMLVGHLPNLSRLASALLVGESKSELVRMQMASIVCLERMDTGFRLIWILTPDLVQA